MSRQVTITLSDGTPHTGTLDPDGFLLLPRGKKPAEPWWSRCEADWRGDGPRPDNSQPEWEPCSAWDWSNDDWWLLRPLPGESWESIVPQQPATPKRDYTNWQEGLGDSAKPEDYDPEKYEVEVKGVNGEWEECPDPLWGRSPYRVRRRQPQGETDGEFALRWLRMHDVMIRGGKITFSWIGSASWEDISRAARLIAEAKA